MSRIAEPSGNNTYGPPGDVLTLLHFNDVYNVEPQDTEPVGGAARFVSMVKSLVDPLVVFSGDAFNPSVMSTCTKGRQMPPVLNTIGVQVACVGNHDFDHGLGPLQRLIASCQFPWLLSNVFHRGTSDPLAGTLLTHTLTWQGRRVGFMGLVEHEWIETLAAVDEDEIDYVDFVVQGRHLAAGLRGQGCDLVVALTHMRRPNDERLASEGAGVDLVLGGHDHDYQVGRFGPSGVWIIKSGTDFRTATALTVHFGPNAAARLADDPSAGAAEQRGGFYVSPTRIEVAAVFPEDAETASIVKEFVDQMDKTMTKVIAHLAAPLDCRFAVVRSAETPAGNFVADAVRGVSNADVVLLNSGSLRADRVFTPGPFRIRDLAALLPMMDLMIVLRIRGAALLRALENGVSQYPRLEGRFPIVSGMEFAFDPKQPVGQRVVPGSVLVHQEPLDPTGEYTLATKEYLQGGKDGYDMFPSCPVTVDAELLPPLQTMVHRYTFMLVVAANPTATPLARHPALPAKVQQLAHGAKGRRVSCAGSLSSYSDPRSAVGSPSRSPASSLSASASSEFRPPVPSTSPVSPSSAFKDPPVSDGVPPERGPRCTLNPTVEGRIRRL